MSVRMQNDDVTLWHGDCIDVMRTMPDNSVDAIVTDPPYGLEFMGKEWDGADGFRRSLNEADTGRGNAFGRLSAKAPEYRTTSKASAGMSSPGIGKRDIAWPSHMGGLNPRCDSCGKWQRGSNPCSCDAPSFPNERAARMHTFQEWCELWATECLRVLKPGGHMVTFGGSRTWHRLASAVEDAGFEIRDSIAWLYGSGFPKSRNLEGDWEGWGTALKPAFEPIVVGRKPLVGTVAANVLAHGTGALNIAASRVGDGSESRPRLDEASSAKRYTTDGGTDLAALPGVRGGSPDGRWPTNVVLDDSQAEALDAQSGLLTSGKMPAGTQKQGKAAGILGEFKPQPTVNATPGDSGGASRFFPTFRYEAKAPTSERPSVDGVQHPTVKPLELMRWLVRLVTPPGGVVLEPFAGSGTTIEAALLEGFKVIGIEREAAYLPLIEKRIKKPLDVGFDFGDWDGAA